MKIKFSGVGIVAGSGKLNGTVMSRNRGGAYARTKVTPINPNTPAQQLIRQNLAALSSTWKTLTAAQMDAWNNAVGDWQTTDVFGDLRSPSGKNLFTRLNANIASVGGVVPITDPPLPGDVAPINATGLAIALGALQFDINYTTPSATTSVQVWATPGLSPGISFVKSEYRLIKSFVGGVAGPDDISAAYIAKFGMPAVGQKVFVKLVGVVLLTGSKGIATSDSTIVLP